MLDKMLDFSRVPWVHLALDPENLGAADGVDFDLTVSYQPGKADIDVATVVFRRAENREEGGAIRIITSAIL